MKSINIISIKNIQITFQYLSQFITISSELYKTLKQIKKKAISKMIGVPHQVYCCYLGVNLSKDENKKVGDIFNHKEKVLIKLKIPNSEPTINFNIIAKNTHSRYAYDSNEIKNFNIDNNININTFFSNNNTNLSNNINSLNNFSPKFELMPIKLKNKQRKIKFIDKIPTKKFLNIFSTKHSKSQKEIIFSNNIIKDNKGLPLLHKSSDFSPNSKFKKIEKLCGCKKYVISEYCRTCGKFICNECRISEKHKGHLNIHLDMFNLKKNIFSYSNLLQNDIMVTLELNKNIRYNSVDENTNYRTYKEEIDIKYERAIEKYFQVINMVNNYISKLDYERTKLQIDNYNKNSLKIQKEIDELMIKFRNNKNKEINLNYLEYFF